ncbi:hypothetical protein GWK47_048690 [Chionoecetes opilio]|uniref:Uncharacterized protein n=1 Tax=Chionoecetes opilio TaxID=41210 RepID=A0A8J4Y4F7_CHIOP|nr:hypothetical protein GWK47_048690 [Chionoecetes opilio]
MSTSRGGRGLEVGRPITPPKFSKEEELIRSLMINDLAMSDMKEEFGMEYLDVQESAAIADLSLQHQALSLASFTLPLPAIFLPLAHHLHSGNICLKHLCATYLNCHLYPSITFSYFCTLVHLSFHPPSCLRVCDCLTVLSNP